MTLEILPYELTVCQPKTITKETLCGEFFFIGKTDNELSLVCETRCIPDECKAREDGWRAFRIKGQLDFSLTGVLSPIAAILAEAKIGIFAVSTYDTDYVLIKAECFSDAMSILQENGYRVQHSHSL